MNFGGFQGTSFAFAPGSTFLRGFVFFSLFFLSLQISLLHHLQKQRRQESQQTKQKKHQKTEKNTKKQKKTPKNRKKGAKNHEKPLKSSKLTKKPLRPPGEHFPLV